MPIERFIEAGRITNTHGVSGDVKIEVWLDSPDFLKRCKRVFIDGKEYVAVTATSLNDTVRSLGSNRINSGWLIQDNRVYLPLTLIERIDTIAKAL